MNETQIMTIGEVCATISDTYRAKADEVTLINTSDVLEGKVLNHDRVPNKDLKGQFKKTFKKNDILYSEIRPQNKRFAFVDFDPVDYIASTKLMVLRADTSKVLPMYLYYIIWKYHFPGGVPCPNLHFCVGFHFPLLRWR